MPKVLAILIDFQDKKCSYKVFNEKQESIVLIRDYGSSILVKINLELLHIIEGEKELSSKIKVSQTPSYFRISIIPKLTK